MSTLLAIKVLAKLVGHGWREPLPRSGGSQCHNRRRFEVRLIILVSTKSALKVVAFRISSSPPTPLSLSCSLVFALLSTTKRSNDDDDNGDDEDDAGAFIFV